MAGLLGAATVNPLMARQFATARQNMTAPTSVMDERYPAWKKSQDQATEFLLAADLIGSAVPAGLLAAPAMKKGLLSMGETVAPKMENYMARQGLLQPITAYHGSPHRFDKFDASKIGTGEGAQAYGHGVYFAESPVVAKSYQRMGGVELRDKAGASIPVRDELQWVAKDLAAANGDYSAVRKQLAEHGKNYPWPAEVGTKFINEMEAIGAKPFDKGSLYTVDLPDPMIAKMLDWDKPLSQQAPEVQKAFANSDLRYGLLQGRKPILDPTDAYNKGEDAYRALALEVNGGRAMRRGSTSVDSSDIKASEYLNKIGIPGIRYLDGGSRGTGAGTSNFVVFPGNEQLVKILSRE